MLRMPITIDAVGAIGPRSLAFLKELLTWQYIIDKDTLRSRTRRASSCGGPAPWRLSSLRHTWKTTRRSALPSCRRTCYPRTKWCSISTCPGSHQEIAEGRKTLCSSLTLPPPSSINSQHSCGLYTQTSRHSFWRRGEGIGNGLQKVGTESLFYKDVLALPSFAIQQKQDLPQVGQEWSLLKKFLSAMADHLKLTPLCAS